jgi:hypothetical protein
LNISLDIWVWVAAIFTLFVYSFLYKDNPFYKLAEHIMVGLGAGYFTAVLYHNVIVEDFIIPFGVTINKLSLSPAEFQAYADAEGLTSLPPILEDFTPIVALVLLLIPVILGILLFTRFIPKISWISRFSLAFILGANSGIAIPNALQARVISQLRGTFVQDHGHLVVPLFSIDAWRDFFAAPGISTFFDAISGPLFIVGTLCTLAYFFFSLEHKGVLGGAARVGIWFLMIGFGASFGYTVMARVSLLIGRVHFLLFDWLGLPK